MQREREERMAQARKRSLQDASHSDANVPLSERRMTEVDMKAAGAKASVSTKEGRQHVDDGECTIL